MAQLVRAPPCHGGGRGFESHPGRWILPQMRRYSQGLLFSHSNEKAFYGILAQLGEHLPYKQRVIGSSPIGPITPPNIPPELKNLLKESAMGWNCKQSAGMAE